MSFLTNYSNVNVTVNLNTANLTTTELNAADIGNLTITGGVNGDVLISRGGSTVTWGASPIQPIAPAFGDQRVQFNNGGALASDVNFTYNYTNSTLSTTGSTVIGNLTANGNVALNNVTNLTFNGAANGQVLVSNGAGGTTWSNSAGSAVVVQSYVNDTDFYVPANWYRGNGPDGFYFYSSDASGRKGYITVGSRIAFANAPDIFYTILRLQQGPGNPIWSYYNVLLDKTLQTDIPAGTTMLISEPVQVNTVVVSGTLTADVHDNVLTISRTDNTNPNQVALNVGQQITTAANLKYNYPGQPAPNTLFNLGTTTTGTLKTNSILDVSGDIRFTNTGQPGTLSVSGTGGVITFANNVNTGSFIQAKAFPSKAIKYARYTTNYVQGIPESSPRSEIGFQPVTWGNKITDTTELTPVILPLINNPYAWKNNSGRTLYLYVHYSVLWNRQGNGNQGYARAMMILINDDYRQKRFAYLMNYAGNFDNFVQAAGAVIQLNPGDYFGVYGFQKCGSGTVNIGTAGCDQSVVNSCKLSITQFN